MIEQVGRYEILEEIGQGGFAIVYRARDTVLGRLVALKELKPVLLGDAAGVKRFQREARLIAKLDHPRIVTVHDVAEVDKRLFIVMRLVDGPTLAERIARQGRLSWPESVEIIAAVAEGLDSAHAQNLLHRDLKPANILLDPERGPLLSDFGLAKLVGDSSLSVSGDILGTPPYLAPETWEGQTATPQTDIYALGCILYEMLMGEKVFKGDTPVAVMSAHLRPPELPKAWPAGVPSGVANVLETTLARDPSDRYATAGEMAQALAELDQPLAEVQAKPDDLLEIFTCGGLRLQRGGEAVRKIGSRRVEALLIYLACTGRSQPREVLADLLWDDRPQQQAMSNLRTVLTGLRKHLGPFVSISRDTVALNPEANIWLDLTELTEKLAPLQTQARLDSAETAAQVEEAVALFQGEFLEGFYLRGALGYEEWLTVQREHVRQQVLTALAALVDFHLAQESYQAGITHAWRLLQLDPLLEEAHQQLMRLLAYSGQRPAALAQYETCRQLLQEEFGVEPAAETTALYERILEGKLGRGAGKPGRRRDSAPVLPAPPAFLSSAPPHPSPPALFVAREPELAQLSQYLAEALAGRDRVVFVTGEAGRGKTALLTEFARRAQTDHAELIVASGNCNAYSGLGDPYLPFRDVLGMLSGDVESKWAAGAITSEHARRLWGLLPHTVQTLIDEGPNLLDVFVSGSSLTKRVSETFPEQTGWLEQLKALSERAKTGAGNLEQRQLFEQYTQVLHTLSARQPLLVLLDDLQWADSASINLLFHLVRRSQDSRILIVGAYRPSDVVLDHPAGDREARRHPLEPVLNEFKRLFGKIELDLGKIPATESRAFVDALLDSEPNRLGEAFRTALFGQAKGHALFTVELLRDMQERGDLVKDEAGHWIEGPALDWQALPARVEAIIEQRLGRLDEELQEILTTASVEGEVFTVQIVAQMQELGERQLLRRLSRELVQRHRLVTDQGEVEVGKNRLSRFQFRHVLFQQYLYDRLSPGERRLLHGEMATLLEELYQDQIGEIAVQLARHYTEAGQGDKAIPYLLQAGDQARLAYAHEAAIQHYRQAVIFLKEQGDDERVAATLMKLGLTYHNAFEFEQSRLAYEEAFALRQETRLVDFAALSPVSPTLKIALPEGLAVLDPALITDVATAGILEQLFSGLVRPSPEMETMPEVARSWQVLEGGRKYIFHLRNDVVWSDGVPVTAEDFEYAWKRILQPTTGSPVASYLYVIKGATAFHQGQTSDPNTVGVQAVDPFTLLVELEEPTSYFLYMLGHYATFPVPRHIVAQFGPSWMAAERIVTNGPFRLEAYRPDGSMTLVRSPSYPGRRTGNVGRVEISHIRQHATRLKMYEADNLEMLDIAPFSPADMKTIRRRYPGDYLSPSILDTFYVEFDVSRPPFADPRVRQAFVMAIDRQRWAIEVEQGLVSPALGGFVPPGMPGHSPQIGLPYDPEQARRLLAEAGFPGGRGFPAVNLLGVAVAQGELQCHHLQTQWRENLGVEVNWETLEFTTLLDRLSKALPNLHIMCWIADYPDPDNYLRVAALQHKKTWWNETYSQLVETARRTTDRQMRLKLYEQADKLLVEEAVIMPLYYNRSHLLVKPWVSRYPTSALGYWFWKDVVIDPARQPIQSKPTTPPPEDSRILRIGGGIQPPTLDWAKYSDDNLDILVHQLFSRLVKLTSDMELVPDLAQRWEILEDGQKYIFHLRHDAFWSDGVPVTAGDFEYAWKRILAPRPATTVNNVQLLYDIKGARAFHQGEISDPGQIGVYALNDVTLVVELEKPAGYFLYLLTTTITCPVPRHMAAASPDNWTDIDKIVTNGPFQLLRWDSGGQVLLSRSPTYHGKFSGNVAQLEFVGREDPSATIELFANDELDIVNFPVPQLEQVLQKYSENYVSAPALAVFLVDFDENRPPFNDPRVRRAFALATDQNRLVREVTQGTAAPATGGLVPAGMPGHSPDIGWPFDPDQARQLLAEAGYPGCKNFPAVDFLIWPRQVPTGEFLVARWREILGVNVQLDVVAWTDVFERRERAPVHLHFFSWMADYPDPDNFLRVALSTGIRWQDERYDRLVAEAGQIMDQQKRLALYRQADKILIDDAAILPLTYQPWHLLVKPWVQKLPQSAAGWWHFEDVVVDAAQQPVQPFARPSMPHTFRVLWPDDPPTLDPALTIDYSPIVGHLFSGLVATTPELDVVPDVARRWEILDGGRKYVFYLRDDIRWNDGVPVTAHDFEYAWKRILAPRPATGSSAASLLYDLKGARAFHCGETEPEAVGVRALDAVTLAIELEGPVGYFLNLLTYSITYPVPRHTVETYGEDWTAVGKIVTNGPFRLESWQRGERLVLTRNEMYHGRFLGNVEKVECLFLGGDIWSLADWDARSLALYEVGDLDVIRIAEAVGQARQKYPQDHVSFPMFWTIYVSFDLSQPPFDDLRVRRAFALAIDSARYQNEVTKGLFAPATGGFLPPQMPGHSPNIGLPYDPAQARRLLAEAGYPDGHHFPKVKALGGTKQEAEYVQAQWRENLGIEVEWDVLDIVTAHEMASREIPALFFVAWGAHYPDPDSFMRICFQQPYHNWHHEAYDRLIEEARQLTDQKQRLKLYRQADRILMEQIPLTPLFYGRLNFLVKPWVRNLRLAPTWEPFWKDVVIDPTQQSVRSQPVNPPAATPRTLRTTAEGEPDTLDPTLCTDTTSGIIIGQLFSGLVTEAPGMELVPDVAQRWEILADGRKYIFHLRSDVTWSDGVPVTATDFEYAWKRVLNPATGAVEAHLLYDVKGASAFHQGQVSNPDSVGVFTLDKHTLAVELERPTSYFLNLLANPITFPVPQHVVEAHGEAWTDVEHIVTNGPFTLEAWREGEVMSLRRNRAYHGLFSGNVERVEVFFSGDDLATELTWYEAGRLDVTRLPPLKREAKQQHSGEYIARPILRTYALGLNQSRPPFVDPRVRRALILAIDRPGLLDTFTEIYGVPATGGLCPPGMPGHSADIGLPYDPVQARQLLAEAGYPAGRDFPEIDWLTVEFLEPLAGYLQEQWQTNLGIHRFNKQSASWGTFQERAKQAQSALVLWGWVADYPDPDNFLRVCLQHSLPGWRNETFDQLVEQARRMTDPRQRIELYQQADKILIEDAVLMPLTYGRYPLLVKPWVKQFVYAPHRRVFWQDVIVEPN